MITEIEFVVAQDAASSAVDSCCSFLQRWFRAHQEIKVR